MALKRNHFILIVLFILALAFLIFKLRQPAAIEPIPESAVKTALTVDLVQPATTLMNQTIAANGSITPWQEAIIGSESSGLMLTQVLVNIGDTVKRGQLLAQFSTATIAADIAQAQASLAEAKANALEATGNASRARSIQDTGALSTQQVEQLIALEATSKARVAAAEAALQAFQIKFNQTKVIAPDDGLVSARIATVGAVVSPGQELFRIIRQGKLEWRAELTSSDIGRIKNDMTANLTLPDDSVIIGKVRATSPIIDTQTRNAIVFVDIASNQAKAGMFARGTFEVGQQDVLTLPTSAIVMKDGFAYVMQVGADKRVKQIKIKIGNQLASNTEVIGLNGLEKSDFVASGGAFLADGDLVAITESTTKSMPSVTLPETSKQEQVTQ